MSTALAPVEPLQETDGYHKFNTFKGFLIPYLVVIDNTFNNGRWRWWLQCLRTKHIPNEKLPQIRFSHHAGEPQAKEARKHIEDILNHLELKLGSWDSLNIFLQWLLWGFGEGDFPKINEETHMWLYKTFNLGLLLRQPHDYFGSIISERKSGGNWNPHAFYPTPHNVVECMVQMQMPENDGGKGIFSTCIDPCVGSGRMLMHAANHVLFLYGVDIDATMCNVSKVNMHLYAPWGALSATPKQEAPYYEISDELSMAAGARLTVAQQMMNELEDQYAKNEQAMTPIEKSPAARLELFEADDMQDPRTQSIKAAKPRVKQASPVNLFELEPGNEEAEVQIGEQLSLIA